MQTGQLFRFLLWVLYLFLVQAAPGQPGTQREGSVSAPVLLNPFGSGEGDRRLLQSYIQSHVKDEGGTEINTWEQEVFFLFRLHDYDRSGRLDGLELMTLISDFNAAHTPGEHSSEQVVSLVDVLLQTLDQNQDGVLDPSELLVPPAQEPNNNNNQEPQEQEEQQQEEQQEEQQQREEEEVHEELKEIKTEEELHPQQGLHIPEHGLNQAPVHQGQPDM